MIKFTIIVNQELVDNLQRVSFEIEGQKRVIKELILDNADNSDFLNNKAFIMFNKRYEEKIAEYEILKSEIQSKFVPKELVEKGSLTNWNLDFASRVMTITYSGDEYNNLTPKEIEVMFNAKKNQEV